MPLINCKVFLNLTCSENCFLTVIKLQTARGAQGDNPARPAINAPTKATFKRTDTKLYTPSTEDDNNFLLQLKSGFKRTSKWNKYRSEMTNQTKSNNLNYLSIQHLIKSINYLSDDLKMKKTEHLFPKITHQKLK